MKHVLITGGLGFIGSNLTEKLLSLGLEVTVIDNLISGNKHNLDKLYTDRLHILYKDIVRYDTWKELPDDIDYVFNLACPASPVDYKAYPEDTLKVGSIGIFNLIEFCKRRKIDFLQTSTSEIYGDPLVSPQIETYWGNVNPIGVRSVYDESKRFAEAAIYDAVRRHAVSAQVVRIFNTYGPRMKYDDGRAVPNFIIQALYNKPITMYGDGEQTRSLCFVDDTIDGLLTVQSGGDGHPYNIGNPIEITMNKLARVIIDITDSKSEIAYLDSTEDDPKRRCPDITRMKSLGWNPKTRLYNGLNKTIRWFEDNYGKTSE